MLHSFTKPNFLFFVLAICLFSFSSVSAQVFSEALPPADLESYIKNAKSVQNMNSTPTLAQTESTLPANDLCVDAQLLTGSGSLAGIDGSNATQDDKPSIVCAPGSCCIGSGVWYTFVGTGDIVDFEVTNSTKNMEINIYSGSCGELVCETGLDTTGDNNVSISGFATTAGVTYYIYVSSWTWWDTMGTFDFIYTGFGGDSPQCELDYEIEITNPEAGCGLGSENRVVMVTFSGMIETTEYTVTAQNGAIVVQKGMGMYQIIGNGTWNITASNSEEENNECSVTAESSELPYISDASMTQETGYNKNDGSATVEVTGGTAPYDVEWSNDMTGTIDASGESHTIDGLAAGQYEAVVTDVDGIVSKVCITVSRAITGRSGRGRGGKTADAITSNSLIAQPNPFSHTTAISFNLPENAFTTLQVYSVSGKLMDTIYEGQVEAEKGYQVELNATSWAAGIYILHLTTDNGHVEHKRLLVSK